MKKIAEQIKVNSALGKIKGVSEEIYEHMMSMDKHKGDHDFVILHCDYLEDYAKQLRGNVQGMREVMKNGVYL